MILLLLTLDSEEDRAVLAADTPLERIGRPEEVAQAILYLTRAEFVTGQNLPVNGGYL